MPGPLTIDNLPSQVDENYAYQQREFDKLVQAGQISSGGALEAFAATQAGALADIGKPSAVSALIGTNVKTTVALIEYDPTVRGVRSRSSLLTPALGPIPMREQSRQKIEDVMNRAGADAAAGGNVAQEGAALLAGLDQSIYCDKMGEEVRNRMGSLRQA